ncbi:MAG: hypothetical protein M1821_001662 [Bathelium mastoideum]|nr:MAG: hypothetical protein M1821_001662 [Bathelium mastoideum]
MPVILEFWQNRTLASNLPAAETRIPSHPDQTEFLSRWYEFHQGYRLVKQEDGSEHRIAVLGEPFKDVSPGYLPRTTDELRSGRTPAQNPYVQASDVVVRDADDTARGEVQMNLEDALDRMLEQAEADDTRQEENRQQRPQENTTTVSNNQLDDQQAIANSQYQTRRVAALRRELHRMRNGVERVIAGLRELGEDVDSWRANGLAHLGRTIDDMATATSPEQPTTSYRQRTSASPLSSMSSSENAQGIDTRAGPLATLQHRLDQANSRLEQARRARERAAAELEDSESAVQANRELVRSLERERRTAENYIRIFGTREEMERAGAEYESPIGGMFNRAWNRYRIAEEVRREERNLREVLQGEEHVLEVEGPVQAQVAESDETGNEWHGNTVDEGVLREYYTTLRMQDGTQGALSDLTSVLEAAQQSRVHSSQLRERLAQTHQLPASTSRNSPFWRAPVRRASLNREQHSLVIENDSSDSGREDQGGLDCGDDGRPPPKTDDELMIKLECKICYQQLADIIVLPCGHLVMCEWCASQHAPSHDHDRTRPKRPTDCPLCRRRIKQKAKVFRS